jgi:hypothetical protein
MGALAGTSWYGSGVKGMQRELDQGVGEPTVLVPFVVSAGRLGQRLERGAKGRSAGGIQQPAHRDRAVLEPAQLQHPRFNSAHFVGRKLFRIIRMASVVTDVAETADAGLARSCQERCLIEAVSGVRFEERPRGTR